MHNRSIVLMAGILLMMAACYPGEKNNFARFKEGAFMFRSEINGLKYYIYRKDTLQTEIEKETGKVGNWKINWVADDEYTLFPGADHPDYAEMRQRGYTLPPPMHFKIISKTSHYYIFESRINGANDISQANLMDTMFVLRYSDLPRELLDHLQHVP